MDLTFASGAGGWVGSECQIRSTSIGPALSGMQNGYGPPTSVLPRVG
jgi:hypothetical protein